MPPSDAYQGARQLESVGGLCAGSIPELGTRSRFRRLRLTEDIGVSGISLSMGLRGAVLRLVCAVELQRIFNSFARNSTLRKKTYIFSDPPTSFFLRPFGPIQFF